VLFVRCIRDQERAEGLCLRIGIMSAGDEPARRPLESVGFASPENLKRMPQGE